MMFADDNIGYLKGRLEGTVIRMKCDTPLLVTGVYRENDGSVILHGARAPHEGVEIIIVPLKEAVLKSPILGMVNKRGGSFFLSRRPLRHDWRQGLRPSNVMKTKRGVGRGSDCSNKDISNAILGRFSSFEVSLDRARRNQYNVAFSRKFSVDSESLVWYKERFVVAKVVKNKPELKKDFFWLKELLDAEIN
ncbi:MAG: hypothetical protein ACXABD_21485 [Candidatus Thorarchaeota archaeon]|jgi:hypothetical protein